jgi:hypothetical protein
MNQRLNQFRRTAMLANEAPDRSAVRNRLETELTGMPRAVASVSLLILIDPPSCLGNGGQRMANKRHKPEEIVQKLQCAVSTPEMH